MVTSSRIALSPANFRMALVRILILFVLIVGITTPAQSADIYPIRSKGCAVQIYGTIRAGDDEKFFGTVWTLYEERNCHTDYVDLISEGGDLATAMRIGHQIRALHATTKAPAKMSSWPLPICHIRKPGAEFLGISAQCVCASACFFLWAGGSQRFGEAVQIHRPYFDQEQYRDVPANNAYAAYAELVRKSKSYLEEMGVPTALSDRMFSINSQNASFLTSEKIEPLRDAPYFHEFVIANCGPDPPVDGPAGSAERREQIAKLQTFLTCRDLVEDRVAPESFWAYVKKFSLLYAKTWAELNEKNAEPK